MTLITTIILTVVTLVCSIWSIKTIINKVRKSRVFTEKDLLKYDKIDIFNPDIFRPDHYVVQFTSGRKVGYPKTDFITGNDLDRNKVFVTNKNEAVLFDVTKSSIEDLHKKIATFAQRLDAAISGNNPVYTIVRKNTKALPEPKEFTRELLSDLDKALELKDWSEVTRIKSTLQSKII